MSPDLPRRHRIGHLALLLEGASMIFAMLAFCCNGQDVELGGVFFAWATPAVFLLGAAVWVRRWMRAPEPIKAAALSEGPEA